jgi:hypothetical protein
MQKIQLTINDDGTVDIQSEDGKTGACQNMDGIQDAIKGLGAQSAEGETEQPDIGEATKPAESELSPEDTKTMTDYMNGDNFSPTKKRFGTMSKGMPQ